MLPTGAVAAAAGALQRVELSHAIFLVVLELHARAAAGERVVWDVSDALRSAAAEEAARRATAKAQEAEAQSALSQATALVGENASGQMEAAKAQAIGAHKLPALRDAEAAAGKLDALVDGDDALLLRGLALLSQGACLQD